MLRFLVISLILGSTVTPVAQDSPSKRMFDRLRGLAGPWEGTLLWSGGRTGSGPLKATYSLISGGSAIVESLLMSGESPTMTTVYHLDGADLRMTHYCIAHNQPRFKASAVDESAGVVHFQFVDVTGEQIAAHVEAFTIHIVDPDHLSLVFQFGGGPGKSGTETIDLHRVRTVPSR